MMLTIDGWLDDQELMMREQKWAATAASRKGGSSAIPADI